MNSSIGSFLLCSWISLSLVGFVTVCNGGIKSIGKNFMLFSTFYLPMRPIILALLLKRVFPFFQLLRENR